MSMSGESLEDIVKLVVSNMWRTCHVQAGRLAFHHMKTVCPLHHVVLLGLTEQEDDPV